MKVLLLLEEMFGYCSVVKVVDTRNSRYYVLKEKQKLMIVVGGRTVGLVIGIRFIKLKEMGFGVGALGGMN